MQAESSTIRDGRDLLLLGLHVNMVFRVNIFYTNSRTEELIGEHFQLN